MMDALKHLIERRPKIKTPGSETGPGRITPPQPEEKRQNHQSSFSKIFRWPAPARQLSQPATVEVAGSFSEWRRLPMKYDSVTRTWLLSLDNIHGNHTHRYVILVNGKPSYDKTCDGLTVPEGAEEAKWQIDTPNGPRVMLMFAQTK